MIETICALSRQCGVSSREDEVRAYLAQRAEALGYRTRTDRLGNLIAFRGEETDSASVLLAAAMDEVGLMVTDYTEDGCLRFDPVGSIDRRCLIGKRVLVGEEKRLGVIGIKAIHLVSKEERTHTPKQEALYLDIGAKNREEARSLCRLGEVCAFVREAGAFGTGKVKGPALTSRIPCAVLLTLMERGLPDSVRLAFTVQREVGNRGAYGTGFSQRAERILTVDAVTACDVPGMDGETPALGKGAVLTPVDGTAIYDREWFRAVMDTAEREGIPTQTAAGGAGGQAGVLQRSREGVKTMSVKIPVRYPNTPSCVAELCDCEAACRLLAAVLMPNKGENE